jgi:nucleotide-binding universal stress UspA family protein
MTKTVLVPIDISQTSGVAASLEVALTLATAANARILLLNVVEEIPPYAAVSLPKGIYENAVSDAMAALERMKTEHALPETTNVLVRKGHASRTILDVAEEVDSDVVVLASHDPGFADHFLGSVAARIVRHAHCSVHVIRHVNR